MLRPVLKKQGVCKFAESYKADRKRCRILVKSYAAVNQVGTHSETFVTAPQIYGTCLRETHNAQVPAEVMVFAIVSRKNPCFLADLHYKITKFLWGDDRMYYFENRIDFFSSIVWLFFNLYISFSHLLTSQATKLLQLPLMPQPNMIARVQSAFPKQLRGRRSAARMEFCAVFISNQWSCVVNRMCSVLTGQSDQQPLPA